MILIRTAAPSSYPVSLVEVKSHLNISHADSDAKLDQFIAAAVQNLDGSDGILDRAICRQSWLMQMGSFSGGYDHDRRLRLRFGCDFRDGMIEVPLPPLVSIDSVRYTDSGGATQTIDPTTYRFINGGTQRSVLFSSAGWPSVGSDPDAVQIAFTAGYAPGQVPETIKQAILLAVSHWNEHREEFDASELHELPHGAHALLLNHRHVVV